MEINCSHIPYQQTGFFSRIVIDYLEENEELKPFYKHPVSIDGIKESIKARKSFNTNRPLLVNELKKQYQHLRLTVKQQSNLDALLSNDTFTITTAHQPNIFTGPLYFIYKILHAIKLADDLKQQLPQNHFVPFYYMGSEDADLDELNFIQLNGEKLTWQTKQTGAVGRMKVDKNLLEMINLIAGQINVNQHGTELSDLFKQCFTEGKTIQQATFELVNALFADYGLLVLIPDNATLKKEFQPIIEKELTTQFSHLAVKTTIENLSKNYKVQAGGRDVNLFYLIDNKRERIEIEGVNYIVASLNLSWTKQEILEELNNFPERFSANVILRGVFQETILPNIAFIAGGGELAYWLELKNVFENAQVPYPTLILRNSFLLINRNHKKLITSLKLTIIDLFKSEINLSNNFVKNESVQQLSLQLEKDRLIQLYEDLKNTLKKVDQSLIEHTAALQTQAVKKLNALEKKVLKAEKRKFKEQLDQITRLKNGLFPNNNLQERVENFAQYYSVEGKNWLQKIYDCSNGLQQQFTIVED